MPYRGYGHVVVALFYFGTLEGSIGKVFLRAPSFFHFSPTPYQKFPGAAVAAHEPFFHCARKS